MKKLTIRQKPKVKVKVKAAHDVLPNDYNRIANLPTINEVELKGDLTGEDLKLLSSILTDYAETAWEDGKEARVVILGDGEPAVIPLSEFIKAIKAVDTAEKVVMEDEGEVEAELKPDTFYEFTGNFSSLKITLSEPVSGRESEYKGQFKTGEEAPIVEFPAGITWVGGTLPPFEPSRTYQFSILNNVGVMISV